MKIGRNIDKIDKAKNALRLTNKLFWNPALATYIRTYISNGGPNSLMHIINSAVIMNKNWQI